MSQAVMVVLYARVSSDQQAKRGTSESQIAALTEQIVADGANVADDLRFVEAGVSGATLIRPQLERLRDRAALGLVDRDDGVRMVFRQTKNQGNGVFVGADGRGSRSR